MSKITVAQNIDEEYIKNERKKLQQEYLKLPTNERTIAKWTEMVINPINELKAKMTPAAGATPTGEGPVAKEQDIPVVPTPKTVDPFATRETEAPAFKRIPETVRRDHPVDLTAEKYKIARLFIQIKAVPDPKAEAPYGVWGAKIWKYAVAPEVSAAEVPAAAKAYGLRNVDMWIAVVAGYGYQDLEGKVIVAPKAKGQRIPLDEWHLHWIGWRTDTKYLLYPKDGKFEPSPIAVPSSPEQERQSKENVWSYYNAKLGEGGDLHRLVHIGETRGEIEISFKKFSQEADDDTGSIFMDWKGREFSSAEQLIETNKPEYIEMLIEAYAPYIQQREAELSAQEGTAEAPAAPGFMDKVKDFFTPSPAPQMAMAAGLIKKITTLASKLDSLNCQAQATALDDVAQEVVQNVPSKEDARLNRVQVEVKPIAVFDKEGKAAKKFQGRFFRFNPKYRGKGRVSDWYSTSIIVPEDKAQYEAAVEQAKAELMNKFKSGGIPEYFKWIHLMPVQMPTAKLVDRLVRMANELDEQGYEGEASEIDDIIVNFIGY